jgi:DNA-binding response OmpR family regulator
VEPDRVARAGRAAAAEQAPRGAKILVVDDEALARQMFTDLLEAKGFEVVSVGRGEDVFPLLGQVDLVLLDAMLPGRDGWSVCRELKRQYDPLLPVIMVTARTAPEDVVRTFDSGADDYVAKPFHVAELIARIESRLRVHRAERALQQLNRQLAELADQNYRLYEQASRDADERAHLLRELDHRVRNNLSVMTGLVTMERNRRPPRPAEEALASLENRMRAFLLVHEALRRNNYGGVPVRDVADRMVQRLRNILDLERRVSLEIDVEPLVLDEHQGFALALALNELLTNVFRHAFPEGRAGTVWLRIAEREGTVCVDVADDGAGSVGAAPDGPQPREVGGGRSIVDAVVRNELGGRVEFDTAARGTRVRLTFPRLAEAPRYRAK